MNRLWVRSALIVTAVLVIMATLPFLYGVLVESGWAPAPPIALKLAEIEQHLPPPLQSQFEEHIQRFFRQYLLRSLVSATTIGAIAGIWLSRMMARPLQQLEVGAEAIATRDLSHRVPVEGSQEMQAVARSFNQMATQLEQAETIRRNLLADVAHELRHPIHVLQGNLQAILDDVYDMSKTEIAHLLDETQHLSELVNDLHELAQAEARQLPLHKQNTNIATLVKETAVAFKPVAAEKGVELQVELLGTMPTPVIDAARIRQAVHNLLSNALRHTPAKGQVLVSLEVEDDWLAIRVQDTGSGMTPEQLAYVFDRFYRTDSARARDHHGAGLGLAIVKAIVEAHDGRVTAVSPGPGQGSTFIIYLPLST